MADDNSPEILNLEFGGDDSQLITAIDRIIQELNKLQEVANDALRVDNSAFDFINSLNEISDGMLKAGASTENTQAQIQLLAAQYGNLHPEIDQIVKDYEDLNEVQSQAMQDFAKIRGYGVVGGLVGPAEAPVTPEAPDEGDESGGGGNRRSAYGISRGLMAAGMLANQAGLKEVGGGLMAGGEVIRVADGFRQLEQIFPGLELSTTTLVATAGILVVGLGAVAVGFNAIKEGLKGVSDGLNEAISRNAAYAKTVSGGDTQNEIRDKLNQAKANQEAAEKQNLAAGAFKTLQDQYGDFGARLIELYGGTFIEGVKNLNESSDKASKSARDAAGEILGLGDAMQSATVIANTAAEEARKQAADHLAQAQQFAADDKMTVDAIHEKINSLNNENDAIRESIAIIEKSNQSTDLSAEQHAKNDDAIKKYNDTLTQNQAEVDHLTNSSLGLADALRQLTEGVDKEIQHDTELAKLKRSGSISQVEGMIADKQDELNAISKQIDALENDKRNGGLDKDQEAELTKLKDRFGELYVAMKDLNDILPSVIDREYHEKQSKEIADIQEKYNKQSAEITQREADQEVEIRRRAADKIIDITQKEIDARTKAIEKLQEKEQELYEKFHEDDDKIARKNAFDDIQARIKEQTAERDALTEHLRHLQEIRDKFNSDEYAALLDRDYIQLSKLKAQQTDQENQENQHYDQAIEDMRNQLSQEQQLLEAQRAFERQERLIAYQQRVMDAIAEEQKELEAARLAKERALQLNAQAEQKELDLALQKRDAQLKILTDEYTQSLRIAGMSRDARLAAEQATQVALINQARQFMASIGQALFNNTPVASNEPVVSATGMSYAEFAEGGDFSAGQPFKMSEQGEAETLAIGGQAYNVGNAALVYPLQGGSVIPPSKGGDTHLHQTNYIQGFDADEIADKMEQRTLSLLKKVIT